MSILLKTATEFLKKAVAAKTPAKSNTTNTTTNATPKTTTTTTSKTSTNTNTGRLPTAEEAYNSYSGSSKPYSASTSNVQNNNSQKEHQDWINNSASGQGGMDNYIKNQTNKWNNALANNDTATMNKLLSDSQRVGYSLPSTGGGSYGGAGGTYSSPGKQTDQQKLVDALMGQLNNKQNPQDIYDLIMDKMPKLETPEVLTYEQALKQAQNKLNPLYDEQMKNVLSAVDKNNLSRGFFGQLPGAALERSTAEQTERGKQNAIAELAQSLVGQSQADADRTAQLGLQQQSSQLNALIAALNQSGAASQNNMSNLLNALGYMDNKQNTDWEKNFKEQQYGDSRGDVEWEKGFKEKEYNDKKSYEDWQKGITESQLTGIFKGQPTMAYSQLAHAMNMDKTQAAQQEKQMNASISQGWARINQATKEFNYKVEQDKKVSVPSQEEFMRTIKSKAYDMTLDYFKTNDSMGGFTEDDFEKIYGYNLNRLLESYDVSTEDKINGLFKDGFFPLKNFTDSSQYFK